MLSKMNQFDKVADIYARSRPTYPKQVYGEMVSWNSGNLYDVGVDIGCGAGHSIEGLKEICNHVIGIEPGDNLRYEATKKYPQFEFYKGTGENTTLPERFADLVTVATAFYWMDRLQAIDEINRILRVEGKLALYRYMFPVVCSPSVNEVIENHCKLFWDDYREERLTRKDDSEDLLKESKYFSDVKSIKVDNIWRLSIEDFVGFLSSTSYVSKYLEKLGDSKELYKNDLINELYARQSDPIIDVNFDIHMILAKRY